MIPGVSALRCSWPVLAASMLGLLAPRSLMSAEVTPLTHLPRGEIEMKIEADLQAVRLYRKGLESVLEFMASDADLFPREKLPQARLPNAEQKKAIYDTWKASLDYLLALDSIKSYHKKFYKLRGGQRRASFMVGYAAFLAQYSFALRFISLAENDPGLDTILNEPVPDLGLPKGTYARLKFQYLNVACATEFAALTVVSKSYGECRVPDVQAGIEADSSVIWKAGKGKGELLTVKNALNIIKKAGFKAWFPIRAGVSEWMGDTKVYRKRLSLISEAQIRAFAHRLEPGDILLERREWYLSNIGLPGFWTHAALYVGAPADRSSYAYDKELAGWVKAQGEESGDFEALLGKRYPEQVALSLRPQEDGHHPRIIEALSEGVQFTTLEHSAAADSFAVLRPRLSVKDKAVAIYRAFGFVGRPYDFDFDFLTDSSMVCTEVIYKAYEPTADYGGLEFPVEKLMGHRVMPANALARLFDAKFAGPGQQLDFIMFFDGSERASKAVRNTLEEFRKSWRRPKWHIVKR